MTILNFHKAFKKYAIDFDINCRSFKNHVDILWIDISINPPWAAYGHAPEFGFIFTVCNLQIDFCWYNQREVTTE